MESPPPTTHTISEKARLASICSYWLFMAEISSPGAPLDIPINKDIEDILPDLLYAARACARAFRNRVSLKESCSQIARNMPVKLAGELQSGPSLVVDRKGVLISWHISEALSPKIQDIATAATRRLHTQAPGFFDPGAIPDEGFINAQGDTEFCTPGSFHIAPAWVDGNSCPGPTDTVVSNLEHIKTYLHEFAPVTCVLHAIACIINPAICIQQRSVHNQLRTILVENRPVVSAMTPIWGFPFPGLRVLQNSGVSQKDVPIGQKSDWFMEAYFGDFEGGHVVYRQSNLTLPSPAGTVTARMSSVWAHEVPPVLGNRWILSMGSAPALTRCLKLLKLGPTTVSDLQEGKNAPDDALAKKLVSPHYVLNGNAGQASSGKSLTFTG